MSDLRDLFDAAQAVPFAARPQWLDERCKDPTVRARLDAMLEADFGVPDALERSAAARLDALSAPAAEDPAAERWVGRDVGPFRLRALIGQGGMAAVFLAERVGADFDQRVAVKLLKRGLFSSLEQQLFRRERQALAALAHPNIARLIDGGVGADGMPYLAMEFVDGVPLTAYCRDRRLPLRDRLGLLVSVCRAVEAAHRALIVHRDIKPSNILVTAEGSPKLLDFGIAKLLDEEGPVTHASMARLTPEYAAPEQFSGGVITTATDVYALGVLMHETLLGERPVDVTRRPSLRARELASDVAALPAGPRPLHRQLRGDLDNILLKALETEPDRRYRSAGALADDLERHLEGRPVAAHPPSRLYRARKFVSRHRASTLLATVLVISVSIAVAAALAQSRRALAATARADAVRNFIVSVFQQAQPGGPRVAPPTVVDVVERAIAETLATPHMHPEVRGELLVELGKVLVGQGRAEQGATLLRDALERARRESGPASDAAVQAQLALANALIEAGQQDEARTLLDDLLAGGARADADFLPLVRLRSTYLRMLRGEKARALEEAEVLSTSCAGRCSTRVDLLVRVMAANAWAQFEQDARALALIDGLIARVRDEFGPRHAEVIYALGVKARAARHLGQLEIAHAAALESIAIADAVFPAMHSRRATLRNELIEALIPMRRYAEAEQLAREVATTLQATLGADHPRYVGIQHTLGYLTLQQGKYGESVAFLEDAMRTVEAMPSPPARRHALFVRDLAHARGRRDGGVESLAALARSIAALERLDPPDYSEMAVAWEYIGSLALDAGNVDAAERGYAQAMALHGSGGVDIERQARLIPVTGLARVHAARGRPASARDLLRDALAQHPGSRWPDEAIVDARYALAAALLDTGDAEGARREARRGAQELARIPDIAPRYRELAARVEGALRASRGG